MTKNRTRKRAISPNKPPHINITRLPKLDVKKLINVETIVCPRKKQEHNNAQSAPRPFLYLLNNKNYFI